MIYIGSITRTNATVARLKRIRPKRNIRWKGTILLAAYPGCGRMSLGFEIECDSGPEQLL